MIRRVVAQSFTLLFRRLPVCTGSRAGSWSRCMRKRGRRLSKNHETRDRPLTRRERHPLFLEGGEGRVRGRFMVPMRV